MHHVVTVPKYLDYYCRLRQPAKLQAGEAALRQAISIFGTLCSPNAD